VVYPYGLSIRYSKHRELLDLVASWAILTIAFSMRAIVRGEYILVPAYALAVLLGFLFHEIAHRNAARKLGVYATYRAWYLGLLFALLLGIATQGRFLIAAPGAVEIYMPWYDPVIAGVIAMWGPLTNIVIAIIAIPLTYLGGIAKYYAIVIGYVNAFLAFFNLLPIPPLDGYKVFRYSITRWIILFLAAMTLVVMYITEIFI